MIRFLLRVQAGAALVALLAVISIGRYVFKLPPKDDPVGSFDSQLKPMLRDLPSHGTVGYVSDVPTADNSPSLVQFLYVQYALAPLIVVDSPEYPFVIGNFHDAPWRDKLWQLKLKLVKDYGNGLLLLRGAGR